MQIGAQIPRLRFAALGMTKMGRPRPAGGGTGRGLEPFDVGTLRGGGLPVIRGWKGFPYPGGVKGKYHRKNGYYQGGWWEKYWYYIQKLRWGPGKAVFLLTNRQKSITLYCVDWIAEP